MKLSIPNEVKNLNFWKAYLVAVIVVIVIGVMAGYFFEKGIYKAAATVTKAYTQDLK